jgi:hypothetical protein
VLSWGERGRALRCDIGGNLLTTLDFMRRLAGSVNGHTFLLVGPYTFSAGIISAAAIKKEGGDRVTVVGDQIGDRLHFRSEGATTDLPQSHCSFRYTDGQFNLKDGCTGEPACMDDRYPGASPNTDIGLFPGVGQMVTSPAAWRLVAPFLAGSTFDRTALHGLGVVAASSLARRAASAAISSFWLAISAVC